MAYYGHYFIPGDDHSRREIKGMIWVEPYRLSLLDVPSYFLDQTQSFFPRGFSCPLFFHSRSLLSAHLEFCRYLVLELNGDHLFFPLSITV
jgi:hypothetical protein